MSKNYEKVKNYYEQGLWDLERVKKAVGRWITEEEYEKITGMKFDQREGKGLPFLITVGEKKNEKDYNKKKKEHGHEYSEINFYV